MVAFLRCNNRADAVHGFSDLIAEFETKERYETVSKGNSYDRWNFNPLYEYMEELE